MKFNIITLTSRSITIELINEEAYFAKIPMICSSMEKKLWRVF